MKRKAWHIPAALLALGALSILGGAFQLTTISAGPPETFGDFDSPQYFSNPIPIVTHIVAGILFNLLAPFQFAHGFRARAPRWHRISGRVLVIAGMAAGASAIWMNFNYEAFGGPLKFTGVLTFGLLLNATLVIAVHAAMTRRIGRHRAWMMRAMAIGLGPATQRLIILPVFIALGGLPDIVIGLGIWAGFGGNLLFVEWMLWRGRRPTSLRTPKPLLIGAE